MALLWAEGFGAYGTSLAIAASNGYQTFAPSSLSTVNPRTGPYSALISTSAAKAIRRTLDTAQPIVGSGAAFRWNTAPAATTNNGLILEKAGNTQQIRMGFGNDLSVNILNSAGTVLGTTGPNAFSLNTYVYAEIKCDATNGIAQLNVSNNPPVIVTGLVLSSTTSVCLGNPVSGATSYNYQIADWTIWDGTGTKNNDFLGDRRCVTVFPNADTALNQWQPTPAGSAFSCVDNVPPVDTTFIEGLNPGDITELQKAALGIATNDICGVVLLGRVAKTDAGTSTFRLGINSSGHVLNSPEIAPNTTFGYFRNIVELDPNGNIPWTQTAVDAALLRITRVL
jgi:hypothetical protein